MADFALLPAAAADARGIRNLIHRVRINPMGLDWRRFVVAKDGSGRLLGCGQLKPHGGGVVELASIAVEPDSRGLGIARAIIEHLLGQAPRPVYLTCRSVLGPLYARWGFEAVGLEEMPPYFRRLARLASLFMSGAPGGDRLLVMRMH